MKPYQIYSELTANERDESACPRNLKPVQNVNVQLMSNLIVLYCIVLYINFLKWPKYKPQGPLDINILLSRKR